MSDPLGQPTAAAQAVQRTELLVPGPAVALAGLLGVDLPDLDAGLPPLWHWVYLLDRPPGADLGTDGHPVRGVVPVPPRPGMRRMIAGGRVTVGAPLRVGREATRRSTVLRTARKQGRSGPLEFVTVQHVVTQGGAVAVTEELDVLYREPLPPGTDPPPARSAPGLPVAEGPAEPPQPTRAAPRGRSTPTDPVTLFRFSALTYNGHRIHYDRDHARRVEGHAGLVVHGPLQALAMAEAGRAVRPGTCFSYRLVAPLLEGQGLVADAVPHGDAVATTVRDHEGRVTATGELSG